MEIWMLADDGTWQATTTRPARVISFRLRRRGQMHVGVRNLDELDHVRIPECLTGRREADQRVALQCLIEFKNLNPMQFDERRRRAFHAALPGVELRIKFLELWLAA